MNVFLLFHAALFPLRQEAFRHQHFQDTGFALEHHAVVGAMGDAPVFPDGGEGIHELQGIVFLRFIVVQVLGDDRVLRVAEVIEVILDEGFRGITVALLDPVDVSVFPDGFRNGYQAGFLAGLPDHGVHRVFARLNSAARELVIIVFQAVDHRDFSVPDDDAPGGIPDEGMGAVFVVVQVHVKQQSH